MAQARLGNYTFLVDPSSVRWDYRVRMSEQHTIGGRVIQVFGTDLGDMVVTGTLGRGDTSKGDTEAWEAMERFLDKIEDLAEQSAQSQGKVVHRFSVPNKGWAFDVYIKSVSPVTYSNEAISPQFTLTLFIVEDITGKVTKGITDKYLERLTKGIGWSQSEYNGPTEKEVEEMLAPHGGSPGKAYKQAIVDTFTSALGGVGVNGGVPDLTVISGGPENLSKFMWALREQESGHNYTIVNSIGAAGAYQYMPGTWANYRGYSSAHLAPPAIQDEKAAADIMRFYNQYKDWGLVAACWYSGQPIGPGHRNWDVPQAGGHPSIKDYVTSVLSKMAQAPS